MDGHDWIAIVGIAGTNIATVTAAWIKFNNKLSGMDIKMEALERCFQTVPDVLERLVRIETRLHNGLSTQVDHMMEENDKMREQIARLEEKTKRGGA